MGLSLENPVNHDQLSGHLVNSRGWPPNRGVRDCRPWKWLYSGAQLVFLFNLRTIFQETSPEMDVKNCQCYCKKQIFHGLYWDW